LKNSGSEKNKEMGRIVKEFVVGNKLGIHARPAAMFVKVANLYKSEIFVERVNGKSIMGLMMLAAGPGCKVTVEIEGDDAVEAMADLAKLFERNFDED
jgi:phosphocarrier protein HPr